MYNCDSDYNGEGVDQLAQIIESLKNPATRTSRRMIMSAWNPCQLDQMALPPCHILCQFNVSDGNKLSCSLYQRSGDIGLGVPFNIASYSTLTHLLAKHCDLEAYEFVYFLGNAHIYQDHIDPLKEQLKREPYEFPIMTVNFGTTEFETALTIFAPSLIIPPCSDFEPTINPVTSCKNTNGIFF